MKIRFRWFVILTWLAFLLGSPAAKAGVLTLPEPVPSAVELDQDPDNLALGQTLDQEYTDLLQLYQAAEPGAENYVQQYADKTVVHGSPEQAAALAAYQAIKPQVDQYRAALAAYSDKLGQLRRVMTAEQFNALLNDPNRRGKPIIAPIQSNETNRSTYLYAKVINQFDVENSPRYAADDSTYCNIFAQDVADAMHAPLPKMLANDTRDWLHENGKDNGWQRVDARMAQEMADAGKPSLAIWENPTGGHGHVAVVRPGSVNDPRGAAIAQAGRTDDNAAHIVDYFSKLKGTEYWYHP
jgi:hypothetical protein